MATSKIASSALKVFVSYSRSDEKFADELVAGLEYDGRFNISIDRQSVIEGEDWKKRLGALIADADTIVFILSPASAQSATCAWEVSEAALLSKRIIPILAQPLGTIPAPPTLSALNYVRFDEGQSFMAGLSALARALNTDLEWLREHTRLLARALEWDAGGRQTIRLLSGEDIAAAKAWAANRPKDAPEPTDLHLSFIKASEEAESARLNIERERLAEISAAQTARAAALADREASAKEVSRRTWLGSGAVLLASAGFGYWGYDNLNKYKNAKAEAERIKREQEDEDRKRGADRTDLKGQLVAYAGSPGDELSDEIGANSEYSKAILNALEDRQASLASVLQNQAREIVKVRPNKRPYFSTSMNGDVFLLDQPQSRAKKAMVVSVNRIDKMPENWPALEVDAEKWRVFLEKAKFEVVSLYNPSREQLIKAIENFTVSTPSESESGADLAVKRSNKNEIALFFFNGLGFVTSDGTSSLGMKELDTTDDKTAVDTSINVSFIEKTMRNKSSASVIVIDAELAPIRGNGAPSKKVR